MGFTTTETEPTVAAILLDLGGVLVEVHERRAAAQLARAAQIDEREADALLFGSAGKRDLDRGAISPYAHYRSWPASVRQRVDYSSFVAIWNDIFAPKDDTIALAAELARVRPLYLLSNTDVLHFSHIAARYPFMQLFVRTFVSFELRCAKPDAEIYALVAQELALEADELLFVDDRSKNVAAAVSAGWQALRFTDASALREALRALRLV